MIRYLFVLVGILFCSASLTAVERPSPEDFSDEIGQHWAQLEFEDLELRVDVVYAAHPDFIPAIIAKSFVDGVFSGKIYEARDKLVRVTQHVDEDPEDFEERFVIAVHAVLAMTEREINRQEEAGRTPEELEEDASAAAVREAFGPVLIPFLVALAYAPDAEIPPDE